MHNLVYAQDSSRNNTQNSLNALGTLEAVDNWLFIEAAGYISQQSISPFGGAPASNVSTNVNNNATETSTYRISPYIAGSFGSFADYRLRYNLVTTDSQSNLTANSDSKELLGSLRGVTPLTALGWSLDASDLTVDYDRGRRNEAQRLRGMLTYQIDPQFNVSLIGGVESNNYITLNKESYTTSGAGFEWLPTERTRMAFSREERFFGPSNTFDFSHYTALTAWKATASKDVTTSQNAGVTSLGTNYDLLYAIFAPAFPNNPAAAAAFVNAYLLANGISPTAQVQVGFLANQNVLQQLRQISFAILGARNTVTFALTQNDTKNLTVLNGLGVDIGAGRSQNNVNQVGASVNWSHQLTPLSSLIASYNHVNSKGTGRNTLETTQQLLNLNLVTQLGPNTNAGIGVRRNVVDGTANYTENAVIGTLSHRF
jgi:uncharacterized protein (PEP-CTERM system associated)